MIHTLRTELKLNLQFFGSSFNTTLILHLVSQIHCHHVCVIHHSCWHGFSVFFVTLSHCLLHGYICRKEQVMFIMPHTIMLHPQFVLLSTSSESITLGIVNHVQTLRKLQEQGKAETFLSVIVSTHRMRYYFNLLCLPVLCALQKLLS